MLDFWDKDHYLKQLKEAYLIKRPTATEIYEMLNFLVTFSMGLRKMGLDKLADDYNERVDSFSVGMREMGHKPGLSGMAAHRHKSDLDNSVTRISNRLKFEGIPYR